MPPKAAAKEKVVKGDEALLTRLVAEEMVMQYLKSVNRPYASTDVSANLKNKVPKAAAQKIMLTLAEKGILTKKDYGKQQIFVYNQELLPVLSSEDLDGIEAKYKETLAELEEKRKEVKDLQADLASKAAMPKTKELGKEIERVKTENDVTTKALLPYRGKADGQLVAAPLSADDIKTIDSDFAKWRKEWTNRRKVYKDLLGQLSDGGMIQNSKEFEDDQGIYGDDEAAVEIEAGEFCKPVVGAPRPKPAQRGPAAMRSASGSDDSGSSRKKARK